MKTLFIFLSLLLNTSFLFCQVTEEDEKTIDALKAVISNSLHDSDKVNAYFDWDGIIYISNPALDLELNKKIKSICETNLSESLNKNEEKFFSKYLSSAYNNLALSFADQGNFDKALKYHNLSLKIASKANDVFGMANSYNNLGNIYADMENNQKALIYYEKSLELALTMKRNSNLSSAYSNIGNIYTNMGDINKAMVYLLKGLELEIKNGNKAGMAISYNNLGDVFVDKEDYDSALYYFDKALILSKEIGSEQGVAIVLNALAKVRYDKNQFNEAIELSKEVLEISEESGGIFEKSSALFMLYLCYKETGKEGASLSMYEQYIVLEDSIESESNQKELIKQEFKHSYERQKAVDDSEHEKQLLLSTEQEKKQKLISFFVAGGLLLVLIFSIVIFNRLRITKKQKLIIENQKHIVEEKNQEITDSIQYAKRIQNAILPPNKIVEEALPNSFILYKPKDIVAGDFYWLEHQKDQVLFAAADCTGHGVPGAMVSVICNNALNRSVREHKLTAPGEILNKTREIVIQEFEKSDEEVQDGMDIALCSLSEKKLQYAGAHNPLWIIRNNEILETKANKQPIGQFDNPQPYTTHTFDLQKGDTIYIFSDGYVDQFGGEKGKKFKAKAFKDLLISIQNQKMEEQKMIIDNAFETWKGDLEQIDDVCVIGVRV